MTWSTSLIPDLTGSTIVVTGSNTGIGLETAAACAAAGARTVLACRNLTKAAAAREGLLRRGPRGPIELLQLDLADQRQVRGAAQETLERFGRIDRLINNAGIMSKTYATTVDGHEMTWGTNHLGHFAYTGGVLPALLASTGSRVVTVSSLSHRVGRMTWEPSTHRHAGARAYAQSKLANLLFAFELQRRLAAAGVDSLSVGAHPGFAVTDFLYQGAAPGRRQRLKMQLGAYVIPSAADAARSSLRAATDPDARGGEFYGPSGVGGVRGAPVLVRPARRSLDERSQARLWDLSVDATGVEYVLPPNRV